MIFSCMLISPVSGQTYGGVEFSSGESSFADEIVEYQLNGGAAEGNISNILGIPDRKSVSLGAYGYVVVKFTDNALACSGDEQNDLVVYEAGNSAQEIVEVFISTDGNEWIKVGTGNRKSFFDIDAVEGVNYGEKYSYVKIVDYTGLNIGSSFEGADMDAVGAITSTSPASNEENNNEPPVSRTEVPEFPTIALPVLAIMGLALIYGKKEQ
nr:PEF-CTERM sorting domain-containing protein [uncultured Methanolobus sp.]